ncbi:MAG: 50S ribosomal protein L35 [Candidatus Magasanikbacteria bacterium]|nr:50S ribosomal protein L35 [Candidatus Magasanikbacteria bacterium]
MKAKTHKATAKRFRIKKSKRGVQIIKRAEGQDHFNSRESGKTKRNKRSDNTMTRAMQKTILFAMPNNQ